MEDPLNFCYRASHVKECFQEAGLERLFRYPDEYLPHAEPVKLATLAPKDPEEGVRVEILVEAWPARFFSLRLASGHRVSFASGMGREALKLAQQIADGTIVID